jgi:AraC family transcriptional activator of pobA
MTQAPPRTGAIPLFHLYGEIGPPAPADAEIGFIHMETILARAGLHNWEIRPHRHADLHQLLLVLQGGGTFRVDEARLRFDAPTLLYVPPRRVHAFAFEPETQGHVLTVSDAFLDLALGGGPEPLSPPAEPVALAPGGALGALNAAYLALDEEFRWQRPGRARAIAAHLNLILIGAARLAAASGGGEPPSRDAALLADFHALVQTHAAEGWTVADYAGALATTPHRLTAACRRAQGMAPMGIVHQRLLVEAKRNLIYTAMSVQEIGFALGFPDPAYFSRFFTRRVGQSPQQFRRRAGEAG